MQHLPMARKLSGLRGPGVSIFLMSAAGQAIETPSHSSQPIVEGFGLKIQPAQEPGHDPFLSHAPYARDSDHQLAVEMSYVAAPGRHQREVGGAVQSPRILLSLEAQGTGGIRPIDSHLLDPCQTAGSEQTLRDRIEASGELVPEPEHGVVPVVPGFEHVGLVQVGKDEVDVEVGICQECCNSFHRPGEAVLSVEAHRPILPRLGAPSVPTRNGSYVRGFYADQPALLH